MPTREQIAEALSVYPGDADQNAVDRIMAVIEADQSAAVGYEVWRKSRISHKRDFKAKHGFYPTMEAAADLVLEYTQQERDNANLEMRSVNQCFYVVKVTTTREIIPTELLAQLTRSSD